MAPFGVLGSVLALLLSASAPAPIVDGKDVPELMSASLLDVTVTDVEYDPFGLGRAIVLNIRVRVCPKPAMQYTRSQNHHVLTLYSIAWETAQKGGGPGCREETVKYRWEPNLTSNALQLESHDLIIQGYGTKEVFSVTATAFRSRGQVGPGSVVEDIVDYRDVRVRRM